MNENILLLDVGDMSAEDYQKLTEYLASNFEYIKVANINDWESIGREAGKALTYLK